MLVFSIITAISVPGLYGGNMFLGLIMAAGMITAAIPGYLLSRLATQLNNIVKTEFWRELYKNS